MPAPALKKELLNVTGKGYLLLKQDSSTPENCPSLCSAPRFEERTVDSDYFKILSVQFSTELRKKNQNVIYSKRFYK